MKTLAVNGRRGVLAHAMVDDEDYDRLKEYNWCHGPHGVVIRYLSDAEAATLLGPSQTNKGISLAREVLRVPPRWGGYVVHLRDHLDCRKESLKFSPANMAVTMPGPPLPHRNGGGVRMKLHAGLVLATGFTEQDACGVPESIPLEWHVGYGAYAIPSHNPKLAGLVRWLERRGLLAEGVPADVQALVDARRPAGRTEAENVSVVALEIVSESGPMMAADVQKRMGRSAAGVWKALKRLVRAGSLVQLEGKRYAVAGA